MTMRKKKMTHERKTPHQEWVVKENDTLRESSTIHKNSQRNCGERMLDSKRIGVYLQCNWRPRKYYKNDPDQNELRNKGMHGGLA
jgi:hypothetical protein